MNSYAIFCFGVMFGMSLAWACSAAAYWATQKQRTLTEQLRKARLDEEILSRWLQLDIIAQDARKHGYEFKDPRARS